MTAADQSLKLESRETGGFYARALRAIGQDLADLYPEQLNITQRGEDFVAQGQCARSRLEAKSPQSGKNLRDFLNRDVGSFAADAGSQRVPFEKIYTAADIYGIDESGAHRRHDSKKLPDIRSLGEMLRTIGRIVDEEKGQLIRAVKDQRTMSLDYATGDGARRNQKLTSMELYRLQQKYYELRGKTTVIGLLNTGAFRLR